MLRALRAEGMNQKYSKKVPPEYSDGTFLLFSQSSQRAGTDTVGPGLNHGLGLFKGADSAGGFHPHVRADVLPQRQNRWRS